MNAINHAKTKRFPFSTSQQLLLAFCALAIPCTPCAQAQVVEKALDQTDNCYPYCTEEEFLNAQPPTSYWDLPTTDEMLLNSHSPRDQSNEVAPTSRPGKTSEAKSIQEVHLLNSYDDNSRDTDITPRNWIQLLTQSFTSQLVNLLSSPQVATNRLDYDTRASDDRLTDVDMAYPYRTVGKLIYKHPDGSDYYCTGVIINPRLVSTAALCVHNGNGEESGWNTDFRFIPAYRKGANPFGTWFVDHIYINQEWYNGNKYGAIDYALLQIRDNEDKERIGDKVGQLGWAVNHLTYEEGWRSTHITAAGYPWTFGKDTIDYTLDELAQSSSGLKPYKDENGEVYPGLYVIGSDWDGAAGSPIIKEFGWVQNENGDRVINFNWVVGLMTFGFPNSTVNGGPEFDGTWLELKDSACMNQAGNCREGE